MSVKGGILSGIKSAADIVSEAARKSAVAPITTKSDKKEALELIESEAKRKEWVKNKRNELGIAEDDPNYRKDALVPKEEVKRRQTRKFVDQIQQLEQDQITGKQYRTFIKENQPATKFNAEDLKTMLPSFTDVVAGLDARNQNNAKKGIVGLNKTIEKGEIVKTRLDIPSYNLRDIWVAQITADKNKTLYGRTAVLKNGSFSIEGKDPAKKVEKMMGVGKGEKEKTPFATMGGEWQNVSDEDAFQLAQKYIDDPEWTQVGFNPERHSFFYDKDTMMPVFNFDELVQVGPLVLAKIKKIDDLSRTERVERIGKLRELRIPDKIGKPAVYNEGGAIPMQQQMNMFNVGGLKDEGGTKDPVSGNEVPSGSLQEEVRDDIDAKLSPGEFVFPADVTRFLGLRFLMKLRDEAKAGLQRMEDMGQMGNSEEAVLDDDVPFEPTDLIIMAGPPEGEMNKMNTGGMPTQQQQSNQAGGVPGQGRFDQIVGQPQFEYEIKKFRNDAGAELFIPFVRGNPVYQPPLGYEEVTETQQQEELADPTLPQDKVETELGSGELGGGPSVGDVGYGGLSDTEKADFGDAARGIGQAGALGKGVIGMAPAAVGAGISALGAIGSKGLSTMAQQGVSALTNEPTAGQLAKAEVQREINDAISRSKARERMSPTERARQRARSADFEAERDLGQMEDAYGAPPGTFGIGVSVNNQSYAVDLQTNTVYGLDDYSSRVGKEKQDAIDAAKEKEKDEAQKSDPAETGVGSDTVGGVEAIGGTEGTQSDDTGPQAGGDSVSIATGGLIPKRKRKKKKKRSGLASR